MWADESAADADVDLMVNFRGDTDDFVQFLRTTTSLIAAAKLDHEEDGLRTQLLKVQEAIKEPVCACLCGCLGVRVPVSCRFAGFLEKSVALLDLRRNEQMSQGLWAACSEWDWCMMKGRKSWHRIVCKSCASSPRISRSSSASA